MRSRWVAGGLGDFLRKIAYDYARYGYYFYAIREIPEGKELDVVDEKLLSTYGVTYQHMRRKRRGEKGFANVAYIRYGRWFVLLGTEGQHEAFGRICRKDLRQEPLYFGGYTVGFHETKIAVRVSPRRWKRIREVAKRISLHHEGKVHHFFHEWLNRKVAPFSFPGVTEQKKQLLQEVNKKRKVAGLPEIPPLVRRAYNRTRKD